MSTLLVRKNSKQSWSQAARITMKDTFERLTDWAVALNEAAGWKQYAVENDHGAIVEEVAYTPEDTAFEEAAMLANAD